MVENVLKIKRSLTLVTRLRKALELVKGLDASMILGVILNFFNVFVGDALTDVRKIINEYVETVVTWKKDSKPDPKIYDSTYVNTIRVGVSSLLDAKREEHRKNHELIMKEFRDTTAAYKLEKSFVLKCSSI